MGANGLMGGGDSGCPDGGQVYKGGGLDFFPDPVGRFGAPIG